MNDDAYGSGNGTSGSGDPDHAEAGGTDDFRSVSDAEFRALTRSLESTGQSGPSVPLIVAAGVIVALAVLSVMYSWPLWTTILFVILLAVVTALGFLRRPPVAPLELTAGERERVRRVLDEHGLRPAVALVRALYPNESGIAAAKTVQQLLARG